MMAVERLGFLLLSLASLSGGVALAAAAPRTECLAAFDVVGEPLRLGNRRIVRSARTSCEFKVRVCKNPAQAGCAQGPVKYLFVLGKAVLKTPEGNDPEDCSDVNVISLPLKGESAVCGTTRPRCRIGLGGVSTNGRRTDVDQLVLQCRRSDEGRCGDGRTDVDRGEACDDGNAVADDGCDPDCHPPVCGNGIVDPSSESCDDGNTIDGDGCDRNCQPTGCGNQAYVPPEECDFSDPASPACGERTHCDATCHCVPDPEVCGCGPLGTNLLRLTTDVPLAPQDCGVVREGSGESHLVCGTLATGGGRTALVPVPFAADLSLDGTCTENAFQVASARTGFVGQPLATLQNSTPLCIVSRLAGAVTGVVGCADGSVDLHVPVRSSIYITANQSEPCPICHDGVCQGGENDGSPCDGAASDQPNTACLPSQQYQQAVLDLDLNLGTRPAATASSIGVFCGYCRNLDSPHAFGVCAGSSPPQVCSANELCNETQCAGTRRCSSSNDCGPHEVCEQSSPGAFGLIDATEISLDAHPAGDVSDGTEHGALLASAFCVPPSFNSIVDPVGDLPGPGALTLPLKLRLTTSVAGAEPAP